MTADNRQKGNSTMHLQVSPAEAVALIILLLAAWAMLAHEAKGMRP